MPGRAARVESANEKKNKITASTPKAAIFTGEAGKSGRDFVFLLVAPSPDSRYTDLTKWFRGRSRWR